MYLCFSFATSRHFVKHFILYFSIFSFTDIKVLTASVGDFYTILLMGVCVHSLKFVDILSCTSLASTGNFLSEEEVVDILNYLNV
jgi:hypothetical protein